MLLTAAARQTIRAGRRYFSVAAAETASETPQPKHSSGVEPERPISHTLKNQHIRYVPKKRLDFNLATPDGNVTLVYKSEKLSKISAWTLALGSALPAAIMAPTMVPAEFLLYTYSAIFLPTLYGMYDQVMRRR